MISPLLRCAALVVLLFAAACQSPGDDSNYCTMPSVLRMRHKDAHDTVLAAGLAPHCSPEAESDPNGNPFVCFRQTPAAGTRLRCGEVVDLVFNPEYRTTTGPQGPR